MVSSLALHDVLAGVEVVYHCVPEGGDGCGRCLWQEGEWVWVVRRCVVWACLSPVPGPLSGEFVAGVARRERAALEMEGLGEGWRDGNQDGSGAGP
jgi:hypothetical protein